MASEHGMAIEAGNEIYVGAGDITEKTPAIKKARGSRKKKQPLRTIDLFCGAGGITEGFREAGYVSLYGNDVMPEAIETFKLNHPEAIADCRSIENVDPAEIRKRLGLEPGELDVLVGGPPCQGFSINAPDRFLEDPRNALFRHYERFLEEFQPKTFLFENVPGPLSLGDGKCSA